MAGQEGKRWEPVEGEWVFKGRTENNGWLRRRGLWWHVVLLRANLWSSGIAIVCWVYPTFAPGTQNPKILQAMSAPQPRRSARRLAAVPEVAPSEAEVARTTRVARRHAEQPEPAPPVKPRKKAAQANSGKDPAAPARKREPPKKKSKVKHEANEETDTDPRPEATEARTDALEDGANADGAGEDECNEDAQEEGANEDEICEEEVRTDAPEEGTHASVVDEDESTADAQEEGANEDKICEHKFRKDEPEPRRHAGVIHERRSNWRASASTIRRVSKEHREQLLAAYAEWQGFVTEMSKVTGKKESTLYKAVGQDPTRGRTVNSWNAFQAKFHVKNRQPKMMSSADFTKQARAAYKHLFEELPEEERSDPAARRAIVKPIIDWYSKKTSVVMDARKEKGGSLAMLNKVMQPFIRQSTLAHQNNNVDVFGFGIDTYGDQAVIWGGSLNFLSVHDTYLPAIKVKLVDIKAMFQMIDMANRKEAASAAAPQPIAISFGKGENEKSCRDGRRRVFAPLMLNMIHLVLLERERKSKTPMPTGLKMSWKWADLAVRLQGTTANKAFQTMLEDLENRYRGKEGAEGGMNIVSWTDDEIQLDDDDDINVAEVPIVTCSDGTTLLYASTSKKLLKRLGGAKGKGKAKAVGGNESDEGPEEDEGEDDAVHDATTTNSAKAGSKRQSAAGDDLPPAKRQHIGQPQASTSRFQPATSTYTSAVFTQVMRFRYIKGKIMSGEFEGHIRQFVGPSSKIHKATQVYVETGDQVGNGKWIALPVPYEPNIPEDEPTSAFYRLVLGLY
ncbi:hypothetical protein DFH07DRAFT_767658 [Mycena maculata]|uniref:Uncharacterized protein n=1 Tax=Mycena maculata TaxID=230809 RepID=A0AAD7NSV1_9AGAR|nr:hypothetical protein DFH07DRAFT_767658 [Mycena maculata]